tara:strand:- start:7944 stop:8810 length:867 start_codon:yes stop_codon:yes gene_type:complete
MMNSTKLYKPTVKNGDYLFDPNIRFDRPVEIHFVRIEEFNDPDAFKVLVLSSESYLSPNRELSTSVIHNKHLYDLILCADDNINTFCRQAEIFPYGSTWLNRGKIKHHDGLGYFSSDVEIFKKKERTINDVSFLASWYDTDRPGYRLRRELWARQNEIEIPTVFHTSLKAFLGATNPLPNGEKESLFYSAFHVCIENQNVKHYFTEKLIDSFLTYTLPIYWGCSNIGNYFNLDGMIIVDSIDALIPRLNNLTMDYYNDRMDAIIENRKIAETYANYSERIESVINEKL